jgi:hypothetical protein
VKNGEMQRAETCPAGGYSTYKIAIVRILTLTVKMKALVYLVNTVTFVNDVTTLAKILVLVNTEIFQKQ